MENTFNHLRELEISLHQPAVRSDANQLHQLLHESFVEIGRSGQRYDKADIIREFSAQQVSVTILAQNFELHEIDDGLVFLTYKSGYADEDSETSRHSIRSSLWQRTELGWQLRFHQATPISLDASISG